MPKNKQQEAQEKRLQKNIRQAKKTRADAKQGKTKSARSKPSKKGGFFAGLKADAPQTVQQSIPYREMYRDGICRLTDTLYTKTVQFFDINYQLAQADDKAQIFEGYCDFLNYFDASIHVQLTFINQRANMQDFTRSIDIPPRGDEYDGIRKEYGDMLKNQLQKGNNGLTKRKYITFGIEADDLRTAKMRLERIETDVLANFKTLGVQARSLNGLERLELLHSQLHPDGQEKFHFQWSDLPKTGLSTKDFISPSGLDQHRVLCFQLKSLGKALKEIGLLIMQDAVWNRVTANRSKHKTTWFYIDEFHLLLKGQTGSFSVEIWKRFRKWGGIPSGLTQNVKDLLASREIENIFENSDFIYMLNQAQGDRQILAKQLGISPHQLSYVTHSGPGEGLLFFGNVIIPFVDHFPKDTLLYSVLTTRPDEIAGTKA